MNGEHGRVKACSILLVATHCIIGVAQAQSVDMRKEGADAGNEEITEIGQITVTAKRREQDINEVASAVTAFSGDTLAKQGIVDLTDVGKFVPNLAVIGFSAGHVSSTAPFIRGIGSQDHLITIDPGVGVYVDGVYLGRQVGQNWNLSNIKRIEVLRGPQGTLFGRNSIGGLINIVTYQPDEGIGGKASLSGGSRGRVSADFYGDLSLSEQLAASISGAFTRRNGIGKFTNIPDAEKDVGELRDVSARLAVKWRPTDDLSFLLTADGNDGEGGLRPYTTLIDEVPGGALYSAGLRNSDVSPDPYNNNTAQQNLVTVTNQAAGVALTTDYEFAQSASLKLFASKRHSEYNAGLDDDSASENFLSFPEHGEADQTSLELQLNAGLGRFDFVGGLYYFEEDGFNRQVAVTFQGTPGDFFLSQETQSKAVYANLGYALTDSVRVSGGLRYTRDTKDASTILNSFIDTAGSAESSQVSWDAAASYEITDSVNVYANIASGYQSGQFPPRPFCLFGSLDTTLPGNVRRPNCFVTNDNVTAVNYEIGVKGQVFGRLQLAVAGFYTVYSDLPYQVVTTEGTGFDARNIIVDQVSRGIEIEATLAVTDDLSIHSTLGYIDVEVDDPIAVAPLTPDLTASVGPEYQLSLPNHGELSLRADWSYRAEMFGEPSPDPGRFTQIDSRNIVNFDISYRPPSSGWTFGIYGRNVGDERYDNVRLNTGDYVLVILSNDASEFGAKFTRDF